MPRQTSLYGFRRRRSGLSDLWDGCDSWHWPEWRGGKVAREAKRLVKLLPVLAQGQKGGGTLVVSIDVGASCTLSRSLRANGRLLAAPAAVAPLSALN